MSEEVAEVEDVRNRLFDSYGTIEKWLERILKNER